MYRRYRNNHAKLRGVDFGDDRVCHLCGSDGGGVVAVGLHVVNEVILSVCFRLRVGGGVPF